MVIGLISGLPVTSLLLRPSTNAATIPPLLPPKAASNNGKGKSEDKVRNGPQPPGLLKKGAQLLGGLLSASGQLFDSLLQPITAKEDENEDGNGPPETAPILVLAPPVSPAKTTTPLPLTPSPTFVQSSTPNLLAMNAGTGNPAVFTLPNPNSTLPNAGIAGNLQAMALTATPASSASPPGTAAIPPPLLSNLSNLGFGATPGATLPATLPTTLQSTDPALNQTLLLSNRIQPLPPTFNPNAIGTIPPGVTPSPFGNGQIVDQNVIRQAQLGDTAGFINALAGNVQNSFNNSANLFFRITN